MLAIVDELVVLVLYVLVMGALGYLGYRRTRSTADYLLAGRRAHPFIMAMSYGATFISTSAIVGFGDLAGRFGMGMMWLVFLNIFVGIFVAFVCLGGRTRRMGHHLNAHTFPELLGRRFQSRLIQVISGAIIFVFMPLYAAAVLISVCKFVHVQFGLAPQVSLVLFGLIIAAYVVVGGMKGVMYTDALQGTIMLVGMIILLVVTYVRVGGVVAGHQALSDLSALLPAGEVARGHQGLTAMPAFGFGEVAYSRWWLMISTFTLGVGIGVLAQPQLVVRFMTVKSQRELNRAVLMGGLFILAIPGTAYVVGSLSNAYFAQYPSEQTVRTGRIVSYIDESKGYVTLQPVKMDEAGQWVDAGSPHGAVLDAQRPWHDQDAAIARARGLSASYAGREQIIPEYIKTSMPGWFVMLFLLVCIAAAMSTLSSQFHALGTAISRDVVEQATGIRSVGPALSRGGMAIGIVVAVAVSYRFLDDTHIIPRATSIFFGLCAAAFLPAFVGGLFWRRMTRVGAIASIAVGSLAAAFWLVLVKLPDADSIGLAAKLFGRSSLLLNHPNWADVDPILLALPLSAITAVVVSLVTKAPDAAHVELCFARSDRPVSAASPEPAGAAAK